MARTITEVSANNTFQVWLNKTNELVQLVNTAIVTASSNGDITTGNVVLNGAMTANTVIAHDILRVDTISPRVSSSILADAPFNISTPQVVLERLTSAQGPRVSFFDNTIDWQIGFESAINKNFVITTGTSTIFRVLSNGNIEISGSLTASSINSNASTATALATPRTITATGDISFAVSFDGSSNVSQTATISNNAVTNSKFRQSNGLSVVGRSASTTGDVADITASSDHQVLRRSGSTIAFGALSLNQAAAVSGQLQPSNGGTGASSLSANKVMIGNGTSAVLTPTELHWDTANGRLGINTTTPTERLEVNGNVRAALFIGTATSANYADLAEKYLPDTEYSPGTVVMVGGENEVTSTQSDKDIAIGVISENPAFMMNQNLEGGVYVALKGRVPVKTVDNVQKGDILVPGPNGFALKGTKESVNRFAIALSNSENGYVEAVIL
jgi:hypothetical protein